MKTNKNNIVPGTKLIDCYSGECTATGYPRHIPGGMVVDVDSELFDGRPYRWTAVVRNLEFAPYECPNCGNDCSGECQAEGIFC